MPEESGFQDSPAHMTNGDVSDLIELLDELQEVLSYIPFAGLARRILKRIRDQLAGVVGRAAAQRRAEPPPSKGGHK